MKSLFLPFMLSITFFVGAQTPDTAVIRVEIDSLIKLNQRLLKEQKLDEAFQVIQQAEKNCLSAFGEETALYAKVIFNYGKTTFFLDDLSKVEAPILKAIAIQKKTIGVEHPDYAKSLDGLVISDKNTGDFLIADGGNTKAVIIGISDYASIPDLQFSHRDAQLFSEFLKSKAGGSVPENNIELLINEQATFGKIQSAFSRLLSDIEEDDKVILYFSGHGDIETVTDNRHGFLLTYNSFTNNYWGSALPVVYLQSIISTLSNKGVQITVITDACRAGQLAGNGIGGKELTGLALAQRFNNEVKIMSCASDEESLESVKWGRGRGVFSYCLEKALRGEADANIDGVVDLRELEDYLESEVSKKVHPHQQHPETIGKKNTKVIKVVEFDFVAVNESNDKSYDDDINRKGISSENKSVNNELDAYFIKEFEKSLSKKDLIEPAGLSAYDWYKRIKTSGTNLSNRKSLETALKLRAALLDEIQEFLYLYIKGDLGTEHYAGILKVLSYIDKGIELSASDDFTRKDLISKQYFFLGLLSEIIEEKANSDSYNTTIAYLTEASNMKPFAAYPYEALGRVYQKIEKDEAAQNALSKASSLAPTWRKPIIAKEKLLNDTLTHPVNSSALNTTSLDSLQTDNENGLIVSEIDSVELAKDIIIEDITNPKKEEIQALELSDRLIKLPKSKYQILSVKGTVTYRVQFVNLRNKKGLEIKFHSKMGQPLNKGDDVIFTNENSERKIFTFNNHPVYNTRTSTTENSLLVDLDGLEWLASKPVSNIFMQNKKERLVIKISMLRSRQEDFTKLILDFIELLKEN